MTATLTATISPVLSPTPTATLSPSPSITPTSTISPTASASLTPAPAPASGGSPDLLQGFAQPNPNPTHLTLRLAAASDFIELRLYSDGLARVKALRLQGPWQAGWMSAALPSDFSKGLASGLYYGLVRASSGGAWGKAKPIPVYFLP
jgi:hypothetical protein